jgi:Spy/CpxP family protein refolding chaperone
MQRSKWFALIFLLGSFVAGAAIGVAADRAMRHGSHGAHGPRSPLDRMAHDLNLTAAQRAAFDTILENREKQMRQLFAPIRPQMDSLMALSKGVRDSTHEQLRKVLTPKQREKFDKMREAAKKRGADARGRWEKDRGPGPDRGPEPGFR